MSSKKNIKKQLEKELEKTTLQSTKFDLYREDLKYTYSKNPDWIPDQFKWLGQSIKRSEMYLIMCDLYRKLDIYIDTVSKLEQDVKMLQTLFFSDKNKK